MSCSNLRDKDVLSKSDPCCVLFTKPYTRNHWVEVGRTEVVLNNLNPEFLHKFRLDYFFEERQELKFELYDFDSNSADLAAHDFLGRVECSLGEIVSAGRFERALEPQPNSGTLVVRAEEVAVCKEQVTLQLAARALPTRCCGKSHPLLALYKVEEDQSFTLVHRTELIASTVAPRWQPFTVAVRSLCGGDHHRSILVKCVDRSGSGAERLIGQFVSNLHALAAGPGPQTVFELVNAKKRGKCGVVSLVAFKLQPLHTFLDFVSAGYVRLVGAENAPFSTQLNCTIAIDFTASNGDPSTATSLHYLNPHVPNLYSLAIQAVGAIIQDYDSDDLFAVLGFGAKLPPDGRVSHDFFVNGDAASPYCEGIGGVLRAYHECLSRVQLYGPSNFAPVIAHVARLAGGARDGSEYFILLILTDGVITDLAQTSEAIVDAAALPLSIIIVGVGGADFEAMHLLDGDDDGVFGRLRDRRGRIAQRDIVQFAQFVPFRDFVQGNSVAELLVSKARLAKSVLEEIPRQFLSYMHDNHITPGSWRTATLPAGS